MSENPVTCVLDRLDARDVEGLEEVFRASDGKIVVDARKVAIATPEGVARLARLVRLAQRRAVSVEIVAVTAVARRAIVAAGLHHLATLSE